MQILPTDGLLPGPPLGGSAGSRPATLPTPRVNLAYGSYYLRYLLNHYGR